MTPDALLAVQTLFGSIWSLFTSWEIPGTHTTPAEMALFCLCFALVLRFFGRVFHIFRGDDK